MRWLTNNTSIVLSIAGYGRYTSRG